MRKELFTEKERKMPTGMSALPVEMTPEERFKAVEVMKGRLEEDFISLGEILSEIKSKRIFKIKGYKNFRDFVEIEHNLSIGVCNKLVKIYDFYVKALNIDSETVKEIGLDRLNTIHLLIKDADYVVQEEWLKEAEELSQQELSEKVKEIRVKEKENSKTLKDVFVEQFIDNMKGYFNCSGKELNYKLALYFQDMDLEKVNEVIREKQRRFEEEIEESHTKARRHEEDKTLNTEDTEVSTELHRVFKEEE